VLLIYFFVYDYLTLALFPSTTHRLFKMAWVHRQPWSSLCENFFQTTGQSDL